MELRASNTQPIAQHKIRAQISLAIKKVKLLSLLSSLALSSAIDVRVKLAGG